MHNWKTFSAEKSIFSWILVIAFLILFIYSQASFQKSLDQNSSPFLDLLQVDSHKRFYLDVLEFL